MKDPLDQTHALWPVCRTPRCWEAMAVGIVILALAILSIVLLFQVDEAVRPWLAGGILAGGTVALGVYVFVALRQGRSP